MALLYRVASGEITTPANAGPMTGILVRMLSIDPDQRPVMAEVSDILAGLPAAAHQPPAELAPPPSPPSAPTPPQNLSPAPRRRRTAGLIAGIVALLAVAGGVLALLWNRPDNTSAAPPPQTSVLPPTPTSIQSVQSAAGPPPAATTLAATTLAATTSANSSAPAPNDGPAVITGYYALMPGNLPEAWNSLTPKYRAHPAGGRGGYEKFWSQIRSVRVSAVNALADNVIEATVEYNFKSNKVIRERHRYLLIRQDGRWKIDESTVLSSRTL
jgi:hypothetical protein